MAKENLYEDPQYSKSKPHCPCVLFHYIINMNGDDGGGECLSASLAGRIASIGYQDDRNMRS